jgi:hypothetical protein
MATVLDLGLLNYFSSIYSVIVVWCIIFAILMKTKIVSNAAGINATIAVGIALMTLLSSTITNLINFMIPWFAVAIIFFILLILLFQLFGAKEESLAKAVENKSLQWAIIGVALLILVAGLGNVMGQSLTEASFQTAQTTTSDTTYYENTIEGEGIILENGTTYTLSDGSTTSTPSVASSNFQSSVTATLFHPKVLGMIILFGVAIFAVALLSSG